MPNEALFPTLLGESFKTLDQGVQSVHGGQSRIWVGQGTVERGSGLLVPLLARLAGLPSGQRNAEVRVDIRAVESGEEWTRHFGDAPMMRSRLNAVGGLLVERLGWVTLRFRLCVQDRGVHWQLVRLALGPLPLPLRLFAVTAQSLPGPTGYRFVVAARMAGVGDLIRYIGDLDVSRG